MEEQFETYDIPIEFEIYKSAEYDRFSEEININLSAIIIKKKDYKKNISFVFKNKDENISYTIKLNSSVFNIREIEEYYYFILKNSKLVKELKLNCSNIYLNKGKCQVYFLVEKQDCSAWLYLLDTSMYTSSKHFNSLIDFYESINLGKYCFLNLHKYFNVQIEAEYYIYMCLKKICILEEITDIIWNLLYTGSLYFVKFDKKVLLGNLPFFISFE